MSKRQRELTRLRRLAGELRPFRTAAVRILADLRERAGVHTLAATGLFTVAVLPRRRGVGERRLHAPPV